MWDEESVALISALSFFDLHFTRYINHIKERNRTEENASSFSLPYKAGKELLNLKLPREHNTIAKTNSYAAVIGGKRFYGADRRPTSSCGKQRHAKSH